MKKAIVFGANGYLGRHICKYLSDDDISFVPTGRSANSVDNHPNYVQVDLTDPSSIDQLDLDVDVIFQFAGLTGTQTGEAAETEYHQVNVTGLENLLSQCPKRATIVFPSSRLVYKGIRDTPLSEDAEKESKTPYAGSKNEAEQLLQQSGHDHMIFRVCVPYDNQIDANYSYGTIGFFIGKAKAGEDITLYGDGSLKRTFTNVRDIVRIILEVLQLPEAINNVYNIGSNDHLGLLEVANLVAGKFGVGVTHIDWPAAALAIESGDTIFSDERLKSTIDLKYEHRLKDWINSL